MKDAKGEDLQLGDAIFYTYWHDANLYLGKIIKVTSKTIIIKGKYYGTYSIRKSNLSSRVIKI